METPVTHLSRCGHGISPPEQEGGESHPLITFDTLVAGTSLQVLHLVFEVVQQEAGLGAGGRSVNFFDVFSQLYFIGSRSSWSSPLPSHLHHLLCEQGPIGQDSTYSAQFGECKQTLQGKLIVVSEKLKFCVFLEGSVQGRAIEES